MRIAVALSLIVSVVTANGPPVPGNVRRLTGKMGKMSGSGSGDGGGGGACFSRSNMVDVRGRGAVTMDKLQVGEHVRVGPTQYEQVYGFYKRDFESVNSFVKLEFNEAKPLELTGSHLVFVEGKATRAAQVKVGDVVDGKTVSKISASQNKGIFAPLTYSGKVVVNDVTASTYGTVTENSSSMEIGGVETGVSLHDWLHFAQTYHRLICMANFKCCKEETYTEDGYSRMFLFAPFYKWWMAQNWAVGMVVMVPVVAALGALRLLELALRNWALAAVTMVLGWKLYSDNKTAKKASL